MGAVGGVCAKRPRFLPAPIQNDGAGRSANTNLSFFQMIKNSKNVKRLVFKGKMNIDCVRSLNDRKDQ